MPILEGINEMGADLFEKKTYHFIEGRIIWIYIQFMIEFAL